VAERLYKEFSKPGDWKTRKCLRCGKDFRSTWAGNRLCGRCGGRGERESDLPRATVQRKEE